MDEEIEKMEQGCLLCKKGIFVTDRNGPVYAAGIPREERPRCVVICQVFGQIAERFKCASFETERIAFIDPITLERS